MNSHKVGEIRRLGREFAGWMPDASISEKNKAILTDDQLRAVLRARTQHVTPVEISNTIGISVYKVHKIVNHAKRKFKNDNPTQN